ncbi:hypothetical protein Hanom_Chr13g01183881 [Helianthus anomalus]
MVKNECTYRLRALYNLLHGNLEVILSSGLVNRLCILMVIIIMVCSLLMNLKSWLAL